MILNLSQLNDHWLSDESFEHRSTSGLELYASKRVASLPVGHVGTAGTCGAVLRGLCLSLGEMMRRVGPLFILTSSEVGEATREASTASTLAIQAESIRIEVDQWNADVEQRGILSQIGFAQDDTFNASALPTGTLIDDSSSLAEDGWLPLSSLPNFIADAIRQKSYCIT